MAALQQQRMQGGSHGSWDAAAGTSLLAVWAGPGRSTYTTGIGKPANQVVVVKHVLSRTAGGAHGGRGQGGGPGLGVGSPSPEMGSPLNRPGDEDLTRGLFGR